MGIFDSTVFDPTIFQTQRVIRPVPVSAVAGRVNPAIAITVIAVAAVAAAVNPVVQASVTPTPASVIAGRMNPRTAVTGTSRFDYQPTPSRLSPKFYYIRAVNKSGLASAWAGPANVDAAPDNTIALVTGISVSEGPGFARDGHAVSKVTCSFTAPSPVLNWDGIEIWITGYHGGTIPFRVAASNTSPLIFDLESTNETITLYFTSFAVEGRRTTVASSPYTTVLLDGQASAPATVSTFAGQTVGQVIRLSWVENVEVDIDHYEVGKLASPGTPGNADIIGSVAAAGVNATRKATFDYTPGPADGTQYYYVRAVNGTNLASAWAGPATITALAPDGTTDIGVPTTGDWMTTGASDAWYYGASAGAGRQAGAVAVDYAAGSQRAASTNVRGVYIHRFEVKTWADEAGTSDPQVRIFDFSVTELVSTLRAVLKWQNRWIEYVHGYNVNYFGLSGSFTHIAWAAPNLAFLGSESEDLHPPGIVFDLSTQAIGSTNVKAKTGSNLTLTTVDAAGVVTSDRKITTSQGYQISGAAAAGQYIRGDGTKGVFAAIQTGDLPTLPTHAASHKNAGGDEVATSSPTTNAIPKTAGATTLAAGWIPDLSATYAPVGDIVKAITTGKKIAWGTPQLSGGTWSGATGLADIEHCILTFAYGTTPPVDTLSWGHSGGTLSIYCSNVASTFYVSYIAIGT